MATLQKLIESEIADFFAGFGSPGEPEAPEDMQSQLLARIVPLFASMEQEPVAWRYRFVHTPKSEEHGSYFTTDWVLTHREDECNPSDCFERQPLYAAPQLPQPAVPDENGLLPCPFCGGAARVVDNRLGFYVKCSDDDCDAVAIGPRVPELQSEQEEKSIDWQAIEQSAKDKWNRRAAMLQGDEQQNAQQNIPTLRDAVAAIRSLGGIDAEKIQAERDAMNKPAQGWIACSERMPLSPEEGCEYWDVEVQAFDGERVLIAHYAIGSKPKPWGAWVDTHAEITHWQPLAEAPQQDK